MALDVSYTRYRLLRCMCLVFMIAFVSLYVQIRGLYGPRGILPAHHQIEGHQSVRACLAGRLSLVCLAPALQLSAAHGMELLALVSALLAAAGFIWGTFCSSLTFLVLVTAYGSLLNLGQTFLYFQWDSLLLETGWLCVVAAPLSGSPKPSSRHNSSIRAPRGHVTFWLLRWLLFRLMFASGLVKLQSQCPTWWGLTALTVHYESQCIPTPLAWYAHHLPLWFHKLCVVGTYVVEIAMPLLFFSPIRDHRIIAFYSQVLLQISIILTGNYNFFNLLTLVLCLTLLDDKHLGYKHVRDLSLGFLSMLKSLLSRLGYWIILLGLMYYTVHYFELKFNTLSWSVESRVAFTKAELKEWVHLAVPASVAVASVSFVITAVEALSYALFLPKGCLKKLSSLFTTMAYCLLAGLLFAVSLVPYTSLDQETQRELSPLLTRAYSVASERLHLTSSYGLFRTMTGVGGRPEVVFEGANDVAGPWVEYEFPYKPGSLDRAPPIVAPHQPRLDWQLWFAALGSYNHNPWLLSTAYRLLQGTPEVVRMLDPQSPWRDSPPKFIRAKKYLYYYTSLDDPSGNWWQRREEGEYFPVFSATHPPLLQYLKQVGVLGGAAPNACTHPHLCRALDWLYQQHCDLDPVLLLYGVLSAVLIVAWTKRSFRESR